MNIFLLSLQVKKAAKYHCDQHVVKMILESAQMLCTACVNSGVKAPYRPVHQKHPCTLWVSESLSNWRFLRDLARALNDEFKYRYERTTDHKSWQVIDSLEEPNIQDKGLTQFALAMPDEYKGDDPVDSYRRFYAGEKYKFATWTKRPIPSWYLTLRKEMRNKRGEIEEEMKISKKKEKKRPAKKQNKKTSNEDAKEDQEESNKVDEDIEYNSVLTRNQVANKRKKIRDNRQRKRIKVNQLP